jgi:hypothetical protein
MHEASSLIIVDCHKNNRSAEQLQERDHVGLILPGEVETESAESEVGRNAPRHPPVSSQNCRGNTTRPRDAPERWNLEEIGEAQRWKRPLEPTVETVVDEERSVGSSPRRSRASSGENVPFFLL